MSLTIFQVDAFTERAFAGNPACLLDAPRDAEWMQLVAAEMNLSETAFLVSRAGGSFDLRWFTPTIEVDLCGHATLAGAHVLWQSSGFRMRESVAGAIWQTSYHDRVIRKSDDLASVAAYIWHNPVEEGLVENAEEYRWAGPRDDGDIIQ